MKTDSPRRTQVSMNEFLNCRTRHDTVIFVRVKSPKRLITDQQPARLKGIVT